MTDYEEREAGIIANDIWQLALRGHDVGGTYEEVQERVRNWIKSGELKINPPTKMEDRIVDPERRYITLDEIIDGLK
ncbi:MAG: hypothetical protein PHY17_12165 [Acidithiobacillus sp.]|jgi:hypothetical protein|nr:hypothetical protein [Acidithiobacillus sp.]